MASKLGASELQSIQSDTRREPGPPSHLKAVHRRNINVRCREDRIQARGLALDRPVERVVPEHEIGEQKEAVPSTLRQTIGMRGRGERPGNGPATRGEKRSNGLDQGR